MDVVPLIDPTGTGTYYIADRSQSQWLRTNPAWAHAVDDRDQQPMRAVGFKPLVKLYKWWRRENPTIAKRPKGFVLEVLAAGVPQRRRKALW